MLCHAHVKPTITSARLSNLLFPDAKYFLFLPPDELASCLECDGLVGGFCDDSAFPGSVRRSLSAPHPPSALDPVPSVASCDSQAKYHCDLMARNGSDIYRYPSPLHAVAVQSSSFLHILANGPHSRDDGQQKTSELDSSSLPAPVSLVPQTASWLTPISSSQTYSHKRLDSYIYGLLQRRAQPVRSSRPRTSISTDPSKSIMRQPSHCVRHVPGSTYGPGLGSMRGSDIKPSWVAGVEGVFSFSPQRQCSEDSKCEDQETVNSFHSNNTMQNGSTINSDFATNQNRSLQKKNIQHGSSVTDRDVLSNSLLKKKNKGVLPASIVSTEAQGLRDPDTPKANSFSKEPEQTCLPPDQEHLLKSSLSTKPSHTGPKETGHRKVLEHSAVGSSSQSQDEGGEGSHVVDVGYVPTSSRSGKHHKGGGKNAKTVKVKSRSAEHKELSERRGDKHHHRSCSKKSLVSEDGGSSHQKVSKRVAGGGRTPGVTSRIRRLPASIPEDHILDKHATLSSGRASLSRQHHHGNHHHYGLSHHHHHHGRDQVVVVAKPKYKRNDYRRLRAIMEVPYDEAYRRAHRRQKKETLGHSAAPSGGQLSSPYAYVAATGSDSEYSAECASLFHSTILDTSEDDRSNYTTNCFGDSESSTEEYVEESTTTSDTEESGGGGAGGRWGQVGALGARAAGQKMSPAEAKAFVKIKASHNLKKKILRFRSGSLKLMTTV